MSGDDSAARRLRPARRYNRGVRRFLLRLVTAIQLTRLTIAFGAVSDIWFVILLTRAGSTSDHLSALGISGPEGVPVDVAGLPLTAALVSGAIIAVGLFAYGASLNDVLDARHDATFSPERPIPAGRIKIGQAVVVTVGALIVRRPRRRLDRYVGGVPHPAHCGGTPFL